MPPDSTEGEEQRISTDGETIRKWADRHDAVPIRGSSDGTLDLVHESRVGTEHERLGWGTFYDELDHEDYAVTYRVDGSEASFEVMTHNRAISRSDIEDKQIRDRLVAGETVTSTIQETSAVETPVIEEATVESELVRREIIDEELLDVDLVRRTCTDFVIVSSDDFVDADTFDHDRYFASLEASRDESTQPDDESNVDPSLPYTTRDKYQTRLDIREAWIPSREVTERFTVESRITGTNIAEAETLEDYDLDVTGLQRSIIEQGMLDIEHDPDEAMRDFEIESELDAGDQVRTSFTRTTVVEDEVIDEIRVYADVDNADFAEMKFTASDHVVSEEATETMRPDAEGASLTSDDIGKDVVDATGSQLGTVVDITDGGQAAYVDPHSSAVERVTSALGWGDDDGELEIYPAQFARVTQAEIQLKEHERLAEHREDTN